MKLGEIPGYAEAIAQESFLRNASFIPVNESICGVEVSPLTVEHLAILQGIGSPFVCGGIPQPADAVSLLCVISPMAGKPKTFKRWKFIRQCRRLKYAITSDPPSFPVLDAISEYFRDAWDDAPKSKNGKAQVHYYSLCASLVGLIAREYHWSEASILTLPLKRLWQYRAEILASHGDKMVSNPSDRKVQEWLDGKLN